MANNNLKEQIKRITKATTIKIDVANRTKLNTHRTHPRETWDDILEKVLKKVEGRK